MQEQCFRRMNRDMMILYHANKCWVWSGVDDRNLCSETSKANSAHKTGIFSISLYMYVITATSDDISRSRHQPHPTSNPEAMSAPSPARRGGGVDQQLPAILFCGMGPGQPL